MPSSTAPTDSLSVVVKILPGISLKQTFFFLFKMTFLWNGDGTYFRLSDSMVEPGGYFPYQLSRSLVITIYFITCTSSTLKKRGNWDLPSSLFPAFWLYSWENAAHSHFSLTRIASALWWGHGRRGRKARLVSVNTLLILLLFFFSVFPLISSLSISLKSARAPAKACQGSGTAGILRSPSLERYCRREPRARHSHCLERCSPPEPAT